jgi:hypothetical protein
MDEHHLAGALKTAPYLPSPGRLLICAMLIPVVVAVTNQLLLDVLYTYPKLSVLLYPWLALGTAVLSWSTGRYLYPAWLRWTIFAWSLVLLDLLTFIACITHRVDFQFGYILVSAQISLLTLWAVLGPGSWQWRLPAVAAMVPLVVIFCGSFVGATRSWNLMMLVTAPIVTVLCGALRYLGFALRDPKSEADGAAGSGHRPSYQFGVKHMLIWLTVTGPLLLLVRGLDFGGRGIFTAAVLAVALATVNLIAIWAVLGGGHWLIRVAALLAAPYLIAQGMTYYSTYLKSASLNIAISPRRYQNWYGTVAWSLVEMEKLWTAWLWLDAALLAALLLYLRAIGYRLMRGGVLRTAVLHSAAEN